MDFYEVLANVIDILQREGRTSYRALKRQFDLDDDYLEDLKLELIEVKQCAVDQDSKMLVWTGPTASLPSLPPETSSTQEATSAPATEVEREPHSYTPQYLAEKILTSRAALQGERKQVTVMFADIKDSTELIRDLDQL